MVAPIIQEDRLKDIFSTVFNIDKSKISLDLTPANVKDWDSLRHMNFILAIEDEFGVMFSDDEIVSMRSLTAVLEVLGKKVSGMEAK